MKPTIEHVPLADGLRWRGAAGWRWEEKLDGCWQEIELAGHRFGGERMKDGRFYALSLQWSDGDNVTNRPNGELIPLLDALAHSLGLLRPAVGVGGEFLEAVLARGGEGVVASRLDQPFGIGALKCKRTQIFFCNVIDLDPWTGGATLADSASGECRGKMPLRGGKFDQVRRGSVLKVEAFGLTARGLLREARPCHDAPDSWLVKF